MNSDTDVRGEVVSAIEKVLTDSGRSKCAFADAATLTGDLGLDSLDLAVLVVTLEQRLGVDPFRDTTANARTLGDLVSVYNMALKV